MDRLCGLVVRVLSNWKLFYHRQSVGQSVLVSGTHLGPATNFSHSLFDYFLHSFGLVDVGRPLWREVGSVLYSFCRASPAQPFSDLSPTGLMNIVYCLYFWDSPNQHGQVLVFVSPRNRIAQLYPRVLGYWIWAAIGPSYIARGGSLLISYPWKSTSMEVFVS
jgi:hypothetical protein